MKEHSLSVWKIVYIVLFIRTGAGRGPVGALCISSWLSQVLPLHPHPVPPLILFRFKLPALCSPSCLLLCRHFTLAVNLRMRCTVPQKCLSFYINSQGSWNGRLLCKHLSCSHLETGERWHQPQCSESDGFIDKGTESSGTAQGLQTFHHSAAWGTTLLHKDQAFVPCLEHFIKELATELFFISLLSPISRPVFFCLLYFLALGVNN